MNTRLSDETKSRIDALFGPGQRDEVARLLQDECRNNLPMLENFDEVQLERFRFAVLKLSAGSLPKLHDAVRFAKVDWRDLVSEEFANDINAHKQWLPHNAAS